MKSKAFWLISLLCFISLSFPVLAKKEDKAKDQAAPSIVAKVGKHEIIAQELDDASKQDLIPLASQIYQIKKNRLDQMVEAALFDEEAKASKKTVEQVRQQIAGGSPTPPSDDALETYFDMNQQRYAGKTLDQVKEEIRQTLIRQRADKAKNAALTELKKKHEVQVFLEEPKVTIDSTGKPFRGNPNGKVVIDEFSEFQCPFCKKFQPTIDQLVKEYSKDVKHVFHNLPLAFHNNARGAARAGICAFQQNKFWEFRDQVFNNQSAIDEASLRKYAEQVKLDMGKFDACVKDPATDKQIDKDVEYAGQVGARGTPTSFINGVLFSGARPYEELKKVVDEKLGKA